MSPPAAPAPAADTADSDSTCQVLEHPKTPEGELVLKLFSMVFNAMSRKYVPEQVVGPRLLLLVDTCLRRSKESEDRSGYLHLLRSLFRAMHNSSVNASIWEPRQARTGAELGRMP